MLSTETSLEMARELGVHEPIAKLNIFRTMFHRPKTAKAISDLILSLLFEAEIEHRLRELIIMRIGWVTGSNYEWAQHWPLAQEIFGCDSEELLALRNWRASELFDERDCAVLTATDELLETGDLCDQSWAQCEAALGRDASIDLVAAVGTWQLVSKLARGLRVPLEEGVASWPPDGKASPAEINGPVFG
ncbi:MAG: carboxymuconolactone decarboxylase family protein [Deltaproteobacteria bacterium]|nr:carboxymuconolactone decarboxylase family protein [Deltaproteobacteria bacterium]MBW2399195.1 carboxymuconolactone decarboxylase family protein [Deltaproteobacteria bacterium]